MPFEQLIQQITDAHGPTTYQGGNQGKAINVTVGTGTLRSHRFAIYSFAAYGSRNSRTAPTNHGPFKWRIVATHRQNRWDINFNGGAYISKARTPPTGNFFTLTDRNNDPVVQVCPAAMFLLFDIEQANDPEALLKSLYEGLVLPLNVDRWHDLYCLRNDTQPNETITPTVEPEPTPQPTRARNRTQPTEAPQARREEFPGRGETWDIATTNYLPTIPEETQTEKIVRDIMTQRVTLLGADLIRHETSLREARRTYDRRLQELTRAREEMARLEDLVASIHRSIEGKGIAEDDPELLMLQTVLDSYYEKTWKVAEDYYALTRPITIRYAPAATGEQDPCEVQAGRFIVKITRAGSVAFWREDNRICKERRGWAISPHNSVDMGHNGSGICWGTQNTMLWEAQQKGDYAQLFLLTYQHLSYVNPEESYVSLRGYAQLLNLPYTDPVMEEAQRQQKEEEERLAKEAAEAEEARRREEQQQRITEGDELTPEELAEMGITGLGDLEIHENHLDAELTATDL
jgi:hypothetical protein